MLSYTMMHLLHLQQGHGPKVAKWEQMVKDWEQDSSKPDSYVIAEECKLLLSSVHSLFMTNDKLFKMSESMKSITV